MQNGTRVKQAEFLKVFAEVGTISMAAETCQMSRTNHYRWMEDDPEYPHAFEEAKKIAVDRLVSEARRRALEGVEEPVYYQGKQVGGVVKYSDGLLMFLIKGEMPEKYRERYEVSGGEAPISFAGYDPERLAKLSDEQLRQLEQTLRLLAAPSGDSG